MWLWIRKLGSFASPSDHALITSHGQRCPPLASEHVDRFYRGLALQAAQRPHFLPPDGMDGRFPAFSTAYVQPSGG
jgi:hypothetical protein